MRTVGRVHAGLLAIAPQGWGWNPDPAGGWGQMLLPLASEIALLEASAEAMLAEVNPGNAVALLPDYERVLGPDPAGAAPVTMGDRQALALRRWTGRGGQSIAYFTALAAAHGIAITITEHPTGRCNAAVCGAALCNPTPGQFVWTVNLPTSRIALSLCGAAAVGAAACGAAEPNGLEAPFALYKPAHTAVLFNYTS
jgi:uncharacterized protein YmfQ (DUF2313 family)